MFNACYTDIYGICERGRNVEQMGVGSVFTRRVIQG